MSKFDFSAFTGGYDDFAVNAEKYTRDEAVKIYLTEMMDLSYALRNLRKTDTPVFLAVGKAFVRHRAGFNEDNEPYVGWWLEYAEHKRSCPVWAFHTCYDTANSRPEYELIDLCECLTVIKECEENGQMYRLHT